MMYAMHFPEIVELQVTKWVRWDAYCIKGLWWYTTRIGWHLSPARRLTECLSCNDFAVNSWHQNNVEIVVVARTTSLWSTSVSLSTHLYRACIYFCIHFFNRFEFNDLFPVVVLLGAARLHATADTFRLALEALRSCFCVISEMGVHVNVFTVVLLELGRCLLNPYN